MLLLLTADFTNSKFEVDDLEDDWTFTHQLDYIHSRYMAGSIKDWPRLMEQCFESVAQHDAPPEMLTMQGNRSRGMGGVPRLRRRLLLTGWITEEGSCHTPMA